ncbi:uncharacterized protein LOC116350989 [Contarinia nasturtii]|uniref:uncharacterized protein LOC116350989 n=1 Tax=Contarinia nasturtii TaxID=265458 RepID=UPI0012D3CED1|nr:uncharacterized protein LOC116350989 [Contarinia nasturtii]
MPPQIQKDKKYYEKQIRKRANAITVIKSQESKAKNVDENTAQHELNKRISILDAAYEKFSKSTAEAEDCDEYLEDDIDPSVEIVTETYLMVYNQLKSFIKEENTSVLHSTMSTTHRQNEKKVKLPEIKIPTFSGNPMEWTSFSDTFTSLIDSDQQLTDVDRLHYLKSSLRDTALSAISKLQVTDANYRIAWDILTERFNNKRTIVNHCLAQFMDQPKINSLNSANLRALIDISKECMQCVETLIDYVNQDWDAILVLIIERKINNELRKSWEQHLGGATRIPSFDELLKFLETQYRILCTSESTVENKAKPEGMSTTSQIVHNKKSEIASVPKQQDQCSVCKEDHWMFFCPVFESWTVNARKRFITENKLCEKCLHAHEKQQCRSKYKCRTCGGEHNTKLHENSSTSVHAISVYQNQNTSLENNISMPIIPSNERSKLLATAIVKSKDKSGINYLLRAFVDQGSEGILITERATQMLHLKKKNEYMPLTGVGDVSLGNANKSVRIQIESVINSFKITMNALVVKSIMKPRKYNEENPHFANAEHVDLLLGVDIYGIILSNGLRKGLLNEPVAQNTAFGWLVFGACTEKSVYNIRINHLSLENEIRRFWENEEVEIEPILTQEHQECVEYVNKTIKRLENGQMMVSLPFNMNPKHENFLGNSKQMALRRFYQIEKRFSRDQLYKQRYFEEIQGYLDLGHMSLCNDSNDGYVLPHHAIVRENRTTTKQRTVYDASAVTSNGYSLNDRCLNGPTIQPELFDTFIRWRIFKIALIADIEKMYRQILVAPEDRKYQKILFRFSEKEPIKTYQLNTVTFGTKPAPYLAIFSTFALAELEEKRFPEAAKRVKTDFYVDDCMSGSHSIKEAKELQQQLNGLFLSGHLLLRKWASNNEETLEGIPMEDRAIKPSLELNKNETIKTLGMHWSPSTDIISFTIDLSNLSQEKRITKRKLLSDSSKLFDPCGLLSPITIKVKILMQEIWKSGIKWDNLVSDEIQLEWNRYRSELKLIEQIKIERWFKSGPESQIFLHGFCDSSERAYDASIYLIQKSNHITTSTLICSKTRVAPISSITIPRLELCGALLLATLMHRTMKNLNIEKKFVHLWTDSSIVITWLNSHPSKWSVYVSHRVSRIQTLFDAQHWRHVRTYDNPADIASRGAFPSELINNNLWFHGPSWLLLEEDRWPKLELKLPVGINLEEKTRIHNVNIKETPKELVFLRNFSSLNRLYRVTSYMFRFVYKNLMHNEKLDYASGYITAAEIKRAKYAWGSVSEKSVLKQLNPEIDENGVLIVCGRLEKSNLSLSQRRPIILPAKSNLSQLIVDYAHKATLHGTIHLTLARIRQEFWILNCRNLVKNHIHKCVKCYRQKPRPMQQLMAPLPLVKTVPSRAFLHCGLDFAGPIDIKASDKRNAPVIKGYICVFVCMVSKAAHLETVGDLSTQKFIMALRRMMSRRGLSSDIYCDQGTNFQGASNELPKLFLQAQSTVSNEIASLFASDGIKFHFNPPGAPSWGGQWESFVKLTKYHLRRMTTSIKLTFEEMSTLLTQIEACLNSRPLCAITSDIDDLDPVTPGHLLIGSPLNLIPEPSLLSLKDNTLDRFQAIQKGLQIFWKRFYTEYLYSQQPRKKWHKTNENIKTGDLAVIIDDNIPPAKWILGRVIRVHPGSDGLVRMATLKTRNGELQRPIVKLCKLPVSGPPEDVPN